MKKIQLLIAITFVLLWTLISCGGKECEHSFAPASCKSPSACIYCGACEGEIGDHSWISTGCVTDDVCEVCGEDGAAARGHDWTTIVCTEDKECKVCGEIAYGTRHTWNTTECLELQTCVVCDFVGEVVEHTWAEATCVSPESCTNCDLTRGEALGHNWMLASCLYPKVCRVCYESTTEDLPHKWEFQGCEEERRCSVCTQTEGFEYGHRWVEATCTEVKHCENCSDVEGELAPHKWKAPTCEEPQLCVACNLTFGNPMGHNWSLVDIIEPWCEYGKEVYSCDRCNGDSYIDTEILYGYHICDTNGLCIQCNNVYDTSLMVIESILIANEHSVDCCGIFKSEETSVIIYKPVTYQDVGMPVVDLGGDLPTAKGIINTVEFEYESEGATFDCIAEIKVQGASSAGKPKKNFNIKLLLTEEGIKNKVELCDGWGKEHKYCLKANYIDYSQSRNVVSAKIFGEIVKSRNDELLNTPNGGAIDGFPILVYNNGQFLGLYTLNIPKDEWMLGMEESDEKNQAIFMTTTWNKAVSFREISTSGFTLEYASNEESLIDNDTQWAYDSLLALIEFVYNNDGEDFKNGIHQYADIDKCIDSMIYTFFICADDNTSKNILWVTLDGKVWFSSMYDMDGTWGMRWNGNIEFNENTSLISVLAGGSGLAPERGPQNLNLLWERIYINYFDRVCARYKELREKILTEENITNYFEAFFNSIPDVVREAEKEKWTGVPSQRLNHLNQILTFAQKRLAATDEILIPKEQESQ